MNQPGSASSTWLSLCCETSWLLIASLLALHRMLASKTCAGSAGLPEHPYQQRLLLCTFAASCYIHVYALLGHDCSWWGSAQQLCQQSALPAAHFSIALNVAERLL